MRKAHFVAGGHMTDLPSESVYSSVVTHDSITTYLGADIGKYYIPDAPIKVCWSLSSDM
jgi:hypothetical protein